MKKILQFIFGSFLIVSAAPIAIALHRFAILTFPFLTSGDGYYIAVMFSCIIYACFQCVVGVIIVDGSSKKIFD